ncbi:MAG: KUP/HAK/KT family potassium transporter [Nitrospirota bacterium]
MATNNVILNSKSLPTSDQTRQNDKPTIKNEMKINMDIPVAKKLNINKKLFFLAIGSLGVVFGDIGTSPLYTIKECFNSFFAITPTIGNVLGILSLIFWSLTIVIVIKYLTFVMKADNQGEGGIMALLAMSFSPDKDKNNIRKTGILLILGIFGTALLLADGIITPAITVLSAIEGLEVSAPVLKSVVIPITIIILIGLFMIQRFGTGRIGKIFGPCMIIWFVTIGVLGLISIIHAPVVLEAVNPYYAIDFFLKNHWRSFHILGAVVLCITGGEALYADMGHFGIKPIRLAWYFLVYPALLLSYFGQGAAILGGGAKAIENPFYFLAPGWFLYPLIVIATIAAVIASQSLISGAFSLAQQAMQLGYIPRLNIIHTSSEIKGQIYIPEVNLFLMLGCVTLVLFFKNSSNLAAAYGIAVMGTMTITTILLFKIALEKWKWSYFKIISIVGLFLIIDLSFLLSNATKVIYGGWVPLAAGIFFCTLMTTWKKGREELNKYMLNGFFPIDVFLNDSAIKDTVRVKGTAVFMSSKPAGIPPVLLHHFKHNKVLHEKVILLSIVSENIPEVLSENKVDVITLNHGFYQVIAHYGFQEKPDVPEVISLCKNKGIDVPVEQISFYLGRETLILTGTSKMWYWRKLLFMFLSRNAQTTTTFFNIPPNRVIELGTQIRI